MRSGLPSVSFGKSTRLWRGLPEIVHQAARFSALTFSGPPTPLAWRERTTARSARGAEASPVGRTAAGTAPEACASRHVPRPTSRSLPLSGGPTSHRAPSVLLRRGSAVHRLVLEAVLEFR